MSFAHQNNPLLDHIDMRQKTWIVYNNQCHSVQWLDQEEAVKHFPKPNLYQNKIMTIVWWSANGINNCNFLNLVKCTAEEYDQKIDKMHEELQH